VGTATLPIRLQYLELWQAYQKLSGASEVPYTLRGTLLMSAMDQSFELPVRHKGKFPVLRPPTLRGMNVRTSDASLSSAKVHLDVDMKNPNVFDLGVKDMGYIVRLGDVHVGRIRASTIDSIAAGKSGKVTLTGEITGLAALRQLLAGKSLGSPAVSASGAVRTPYGLVKLPG
jgi:hypothetical protein